MTENQPEIAPETAPDTTEETPQEVAAESALDARELSAAREAGAETAEAGAPEEGRLVEADADEEQVPLDEDDDEDPSQPAAATDADDEHAGESREDRLKRLEEEGDIAADYLEELLDIADLDGDIDIDVDGDRASVEIRGSEQLSRLNKPKGELMDALQELSRLAVQTRTGNRSRLMLDIDGFRAEHRSSLEELAAQAVAEAKSGSEPVPMRPMNPFERKVVHDVAKREGLRSESEGEGKGRHVVIFPAS